jgi:hypothetical protein
MGKNTITDELIEQKMAAKGFSEQGYNDDDRIRESVMSHYEIELTTDWSDHHDFYIYEETTSDGYSVYIATSDYKNINISEDVHYYDNSLFGELVEFIKYSDTGAVIYVDDLCQDYIDDAFRDLYTDLCERYHEESVNELIDEGYQEEMIQDLTSNRI